MASFSLELKLQTISHWAEIRRHGPFTVKPFNFYLAAIAKGKCLVNSFLYVVSIRRIL